MVLRMTMVMIWLVMILMEDDDHNGDDAQCQQ